MLGVVYFNNYRSKTLVTQQSVTRFVKTNLVITSHLCPPLTYWLQKPVVSLLNYNSYLAAASGVTQFITIIDVNPVTLLLLKSDLDVQRNHLSLSSIQVLAKLQNQCDKFCVTSSSEFVTP